jgi:hypothetical protein
MPPIEPKADKPAEPPKPASSPESRKVAEFHRYDDVDVSQTAHHHTIGILRGQAADGRHIHQNGNGHPLFDASVDIISGSRAAAVGSILDQICDLLEKLGASNATTP